MICEWNVPAFSCLDALACGFCCYIYFSFFGVRDFWSFSVLSVLIRILSESPERVRAGPAARSQLGPTPRFHHGFVVPHDVYGFGKCRISN